MLRSDLDNHVVFTFLLTILIAKKSYSSLKEKLDERPYF